MEKLNRDKSPSFGGCHPSSLKEPNNKAAKLLTQIYNLPLNECSTCPLKMCCSRALYTANQIFFSLKNSGGGDLCHFHEVTRGSSWPLCQHRTLGLDGRSKTCCSPAPRFPPGRADIFSRAGSSSSVLPFPR